MTGKFRLSSDGKRKQRDGALRKNQKEALEIKITVTEIKNDFDKLIHRLNSRGKNQSAGRWANRNFEAEMQRQQIMAKTEKNSQDLWDNFKRCGTHTTMWTQNDDTEGKIQTKKEHIL